MTEPRALDEPLSDAELDELEAFLASDSVPQDCMDLEMLDGFLTAVVSGPDVVQPSEWLPQVWSEGGKSAAPAFSGSEQAQRILDDWATMRAKFVKVFPNEYRRALGELAAARQAQSRDREPVLPGR